MTLTRLLVIDASTNKRIATELKSRGRAARSTTEMGLRCALDPELLSALRELDDGWVLVAADDHMPEDHSDVVYDLRPTIAIIDPVVPADYDSDDEYERDVVHKWAHRIQLQEEGTIFRYNIRGRHVWKSPRRPSGPFRAQPPAAPES